MGKLATLAQSMSPWLRIPDNTGVTCLYKGFEVVDDTRNPGQQKVRYTVEVNGKDKWFESASSSVMLAFDTIEAGEEIVIFKSVKGNKTRYEVKSSDDDGGDEHVPVE